MIIHACDVCNTARVLPDRPWLTLQLDAIAPEDAQVIDLCSVRCGYAFFTEEMEGELSEQEAHMEEPPEEAEEAIETRTVQLRPSMSLADFAAESQMGDRRGSEPAVKGSDTFRRQV